MKKLLTLVLALMLLINIAGCAKTENGNKGNSATTNPSTTEAALSGWGFYNQRAEVFVEAMADGDFEAAVAMFDMTMKRAISVSVLKNDIWGTIVAQAGKFISIHEIENQLYDGYYICFTTSRHENRGVTLRVVFSENGLVSGLFIDGYPMIEDRSVQREGFTDFPIVIGEGTDFPLNGILSMPDNVTGKVPAVVLVHGSGAHDMDETIYANKPFRDIAEYLAANGIAVIRYDKRTFSHGTKIIQQFGGSATVKEETTEDAILAADMLKSDPRIDENRVFILGHSLGGMLATRIHAEGGNFAGIISLAGSPRSLLDISYDQQAVYVNGMPDGDEKTFLLLQLARYDEQVEALMNLPDDEAKNTPMSGGVSVYYYKEMDKHSVSEYLNETAVPFLILQGSKDFQVYADNDFVLWQELLAGRANATFRLYEGLNHLFMPSTGKSITEYQEEYKIENRVDSQVLADIAEWIRVN